MAHNDESRVPEAADGVADLRHAVEAYYLSPPIWVGEPPARNGVDVDLSVLGDEVYSRTLTEGTEVRVVREGLFMFDFAGWLRERESPSDTRNFDVLAEAILGRVQVLNTHLACLYSTISKRDNRAVEKMFVRPADRIVMTNLDDAKGSMGFGNPVTSQLALSRFRSTYSGPPLFDWRMSARTSVSVGAIDDSVAALEAVLKLPPETGLALVPLLLLACRALEDHDYAMSLLTSWVVAERLFAIEWQEYLRANRIRDAISFIDRARLTRLEDTRTFTAGVIAEVLSLVGVLDRNTYRTSVRVRKARNDWVHELQPISRQLALEALALGQELLRSNSGVDLDLAPVLSLHG
jgi:hypothetical protein